MREGTERRLEVPHGLAVGLPRQSLLPRLTAVCQSLGPHLAPQGMVGQAVDLLRSPVGRECLKGASTIWACRACRRSWRSVLYATSCVRACLKVYSYSGKSRVSYRNSAAWRCASPPYSATSGISAIACNSGKGTSLPITAAVLQETLFLACRQVGGLPHGGVVHVQVIADRPHHDFPRIEAHANLHLQVVGLAHLLRVTAHGRLHRQRGVTGPHSVVFVGHRRPQKRAIMPAPNTWFTVPS